jgi:hypothetical protein
MMWLSSQPACKLRHWEYFRRTWFRSLISQLSHPCAWKTLNDLISNIQIGNKIWISFTVLEHNNLNGVTVWLYLLPDSSVSNIIHNWIPKDIWLPFSALWYLANGITNSAGLALNVHISGKSVWRLYTTDNLAILDPTNEFHHHTKLSKIIFL